MQELARANAELAEVRQERNTQRVGEWLQTASGLSHVRAAAAVAAIDGQPAAVPPSPAPAPAPSLSTSAASRTPPAPVLKPQPPVTPRGQPAAHPDSPNAHQDLQTIREEHTEVHGVHGSVSTSLGATGTGNNATGSVAAALAAARAAIAAGTGAYDAMSAASTSGELPIELITAVGMWENELHSLRARVRQLEGELASAQEAQAKVRCRDWGQLVRAWLVAWMV